MAAFESGYSCKTKMYSYRNGAVNRGVSAQTVGEFLEDMDDRGIAITSQSFLDESRPEEAPTHKIFTWDDLLAAENWRLHESKNLLNHLECTYVVTREEDRVVEVQVEEVSEDIMNMPIKSIAYVNVNPKGFGKKAHFVPMEQAMNNKEMRNQVLDNALMELRQFRKKYAMMKELSVVFQSIDIVTKEYGEEEGEEDG